jgi:hypothetical protein
VVVVAQDSNPGLRALFLRDPRNAIGLMENIATSKSLSPVVTWLCKEVVNPLLNIGVVKEVAGYGRNRIFWADAV